MDMDKRDILARAQEEQVDDGAIEAEHRGNLAGWIGFSIVFIFISTFSTLVGGGPHFEVCAMYTAFLATQDFPLWKFSRRKIYLAEMIVSGTITIVFLAVYIFDTLGVDL